MAAAYEALCCRVADDLGPHLAAAALGADGAGALPQWQEPFAGSQSQSIQHFYQHTNRNAHFGARSGLDVGSVVWDVFSNQL